ncbi:hypothetical protein LNKW23_47880 [Paralimibaculum aggregatum]|uniref:Restriction endonuclease domain-containing protein n=1 Tax=Paralimibaculum aggregatum TaxID=3036245 RepID=A0ABQ6LU06_9RHOB|nr:hypothetical protein LNKW23_47880 [Limibaculum sp. NKW23]
MTEHRAVATSRATYQDVLDAPEHVIAEILNGRLHLQPRPRSRHALACSTLGGEIGGSLPLCGCGLSCSKGRFLQLLSTHTRRIGPWRLCLRAKRSSTFAQKALRSAKRSRS